MTTAPTNAQVDALANDVGVASNLFTTACVDEGNVTYWYVGYTQNDSTMAIIQLPGDPTANMAAASICRGLVVDYSNITVREYPYVFVQPDDVTSTSQVTTSFLADSTEQTRVNNPSNWLTAP